MTDPEFEEALRGPLAEAADTVAWPEERGVDPLRLLLPLPPPLWPRT